MPQTVKQRKRIESFSKSQSKRLTAQGAEPIVRKRKGPVKVKEFRPLGHDADYELTDRPEQVQRVDGAPQPDGPHFDPLDDELPQVRDEIPSVPIWGVRVFWILCAISAGFSGWGLVVLGRWLWSFA